MPTAEASFVCSVRLPDAFRAVAFRMVVYSHCAALARPASSRSCEQHGSVLGRSACRLVCCWRSPASRRRPGEGCRPAACSGFQRHWQYQRQCWPRAQQRLPQPCQSRWLPAQLWVRCLRPGQNALQRQCHQPPEGKHPTPLRGVPGTGSRPQGGSTGL